MTSIFFPLCLVVVFALASLPCDAQFGRFMQISPLIPNDDERDMCESVAEAEGLKLKKVEKVFRKTCEVVCKFNDNTNIVLNSPKDTPCCDIVGVGPTGLCDGEGTCNMMGMKGMKE
ncbi:hypothetical protein TNCV_1351321 [Trichonephila clavipes]|nr:hypothetical protein TNCV_1351321 [Trichonephila clavipes]